MMEETTSTVIDQEAVETATESTITVEVVQELQDIKYATWFETGILLACFVALIFNTYLRGWKR